MHSPVSASLPSAVEGSPSLPAAPVPLKRSLRLSKEGKYVSLNAFVAKARVASRVDPSRQAVFVSAVVFGELPVDLLFDHTYEAFLQPCKLEELEAFLEEETVSESDPSEFLKKRFPSGLERLYRIVQLEPVVYHANLSFSEEGMQWRTDMVGGPVVSRAHLARVTTEENSTKKNNRQKFQCHAVVFGNMPEKATKDLLFEFSYDSVVEPSTFEAMQLFFKDNIQDEDEECDTTDFLRALFPSERRFFRIRRFEPVLYNVSMTLSRESLVFNRNWSGKMFAKTFLSAEESLGHATTDDDVPDEDSGLVVSGARLTVVESSSKPKRGLLKKKNKKQVKAIVFGESAVKMLCDFTYSAQVERCTLEELVEFYKQSFGENGEHAFNFSSAYRSKKTSTMDDDFFVIEEQTVEQQTGKKKKVKTDLRKYPETLFKTRFESEIVGTNGLPNIFRIVRFNNIGVDVFPQTIATFRKRFPASLIGMKADVYKPWLKSIENLFTNSELGRLGKLYNSTMLSYRNLKSAGAAPHAIARAKQQAAELKAEMRVATAPFYQNDAVLKSLDSRRFLTNLDKRVMKDHLKFFATCADYWKVARDFPSHIMDYVLKPCQRKVGCEVCTEMLKYHRQNVLDGAIDRILYPGSPWLRKRGKLPFSQNLRFCADKWKVFARYPKFANKVPKAAIQRAMLFKNLIDMRKRRSRTTFEVQDRDKMQFDLMDGAAGPFYLQCTSSEQDIASSVLFLDPAEPLPEDEDAVQEALYEFLSNVLKNESLVRTDKLEFALTYDFERELQLYLHLRNSWTRVYENVLPFYCSKVLFPNPDLKKLLPSGYEYSDTGPVCIAFARRRRVRDLLKQIEELREAKKRFIFHVDSKSENYCFDEREDLQDWFTAIYRQGTAFVDGQTVPYGPEPLPSIKEGDGVIDLSLDGISSDATPKKKTVTSVGELKKLMDMAVEGKCFLVCNNEKKRKDLLRQSEKFRSGPHRKVLHRSFPSLGRSSYNLTTKAFKDLNGEEEATITLPTRMSVFCPRKAVYCIGDHWTPWNRKLANYLATEEGQDEEDGGVFEIHVAGNFDFIKEFQYWQYSTEETRYKNNTKRGNAWSDVSYRVGAFASIHKFVDQCHKNVEKLRSQKRQEDSAEVALEKRKRMAKELQRQRDLARERREEQRQQVLLEREAKRPKTAANNSPMKTVTL